MSLFFLPVIACLAVPVVVAPANAAVVGDFQFNTAGDTQGWADRGVGTGHSDLTSDGQSLTALSPGADPQLVYTGTLERAADATWDSVTFRIRETETPGSPAIAFDPTGMVVQINGGGRDGLLASKPADFTFETSGDGFTTVTVSIASFNGQTINALRIDPIGGSLKNSNSDTPGNIYEIDFIQVADSSLAGNGGS